jgi:beta-phosphoglucomutase-like phosphatase (HAD superfamily)
MRNLFIFDLDGTIVDTQIPFHASVESEILQLFEEVDISPEELSLRYSGIPTKKVFEESAPGCDSDFLVKEKWERMYSLTNFKSMECLPEMYELIKDLDEKGHGLAIASASPLKWIELCIKNALRNNDRSFSGKRLSHIFSGKYFSAEDCANPKPAPDVFLKAFSELQGNQLGMSIEDALGCTYVVGDGRSDVLASLAAKLPILYLSPVNTEFDKNRWVKRFSSSEELSTHIRENLLN